MTEITTTENKSKMITKEEIVQMRFPIKLWILINTPNNNVIKWNSDGSSIIIDLFALDGYLCSVKSIFKTKSRAAFLEHLNSYGFELLNSATSSSVTSYEYRHKNFQQEKIELIGKITRQPDAVSKENSTTTTSRLEDESLPEQKQEDPCCRKIPALSNIQKARLNLRIVLEIQAQNEILHEKLSECGLQQPTNDATASVIELPADTFENPFENVSGFEENTEYAGFYGNGSTEQIKQFFGEYLPVYVQGNGEDETIDKIFEDNISENEEVTSNTPCNIDATGSEQLNTEDSSYPSNFQINYSVSLNENENEECTVNILNNPSQAIISEMNCTGIDDKRAAEIDFMNSSTLEPLFTTGCDDDDENDINNKEDDISMDEYLKFKGIPMEIGDNDNAIDNKITMKIEDKNEVNVKTEEKIEEEEDNQTTISVDENKIDIQTEFKNDEKTDDFKDFLMEYNETISLLYE